MDSPALDSPPYETFADRCLPSQDLGEHRVMSASGGSLVDDGHGGAMSETRCGVSMSLDGFITGPDAGMGDPLSNDDGSPSPSPLSAIRVSNGSHRFGISSA